MYFTRHNNNMKKNLLLFVCLHFLMTLAAQQADKYILLKPDRVFDGAQMQTGLVVLLKYNAI